MEPKEFQVKLELVRIFLRLIYCQRMATSQKSSNVRSSFSVEGKPWDRAQGHPALSSPVGLWVQWSKFFPGPRLNLERCLSNFLSMDLEASESLKLWAFYTSILASSWAHEPLSLIAHTSCMGDSWSGFWIQGKPATSADGEIWNKRSGRESLVPKCYPIVRASWCRELKLSWVSAQLLTAPLNFFLTSELWSHLGQPKFVHSYISEILE